MAKIKHKVDMGLLVSLMKGEGVVLCGDGSQPSVELVMDREEVVRDVQDAIDAVEREWEW